jgi:glutamate racemase
MKNLNQAERDFLFRNKKICIFDSGVGGLSIDQQIARHCPELIRIYCSDNAHFPYGTKSDDFITDRVPEVIKKLEETYHPDVFIIACNTASTVALDKVRKITDRPVIGVVPAIKPAALRSKTRRIALLATPATIRRTYTKKLIDDFSLGCEVLMIGSQQLVEQAELKLRHEKIDLALIKSVISPIFEDSSEQPIDSIVLGCTHFPLLLDDLRAIAPEHIQWHDSSDAIARRLIEILKSFEAATPKLLEESMAVFTSDHQQINTLRPALRERGYSKTTILAI